MGYRWTVPTDHPAAAARAALGDALDGIGIVGEPRENVGMQC
ncbi:hypothetical protein [Streptomyces iconiensis]|uniref:Uncharacterized protein n=1 Tax=Streptomyces iconiensis TaxID=1384038 RepID=A0ABT7A396_9ACTN|nr:hypothetical protein [Streptomyces iconiensis]MDJ1135813.1 hypothetical protein [Streptomyces iconiensis]